MEREVSHTGRRCAVLTARPTARPLTFLLPAASHSNQIPTSCMTAANSCKDDAGTATCGSASAGAAITDTSIPGGGREQVGPAEPLLLRHPWACAGGLQLDRTHPPECAEIRPTQYLARPSDREGASAGRHQCRLPGKGAAGVCSARVCTMHPQCVTVPIWCEPSSWTGTTMHAGSRPSQAVPAYNQPAYHLLPLPVLQVFADGIPPRPNGLFPPNDPLLRRLAADPHCHPFEKHLPGEDSCYELLLPNGGWATGDAAAARGVDLRLFYKVGRGTRSAVWGLDDNTTSMQHRWMHALCYAWRMARGKLRMPCAGAGCG